MEADFIAKIASIVLIDLVLSGDNAVVIGMAARRLPADARKRAILFGGVGAVVLRVTFTILAALLLDIPLLRAIGGVLLLWIAYKLVRPHEETHNVSAANSLSQAVKTIILADFVMSLDNILAVGGASEGHRTPAALRHSDRPQGQRRYVRHADHRRLGGARRLCAL